MSSSNSPCARCKILRQKCTQECVFAPYFPPDQPQKFASVHQVFGASNVAKLLNELNPNQREAAVNSLAYEAEERLRDPIYGCVGLICLLQQKLKQLQGDLYAAKKELSHYIGPNAAPPILQQQSYMPQQQVQNMLPLIGVPTATPATEQGGRELVMREHLRYQQQQFLEAQQLAAAQHQAEYDMYRSYEQQQQSQIEGHQQQQLLQEQELLRFNDGFDASGAFELLSSDEKHIGPSC
ncbi:LOB domain-containing protein 36-like [Euphorbia lathyris]|uniref:LOB domain-containing protein 36-like n=1 Tax=Euphorbia lathyris TaxID=212925 RepID=UPI0033137289